MSVYDNVVEVDFDDIEDDDLDIDDELEYALDDMEDDDIDDDAFMEGDGDDSFDAAERRRRRRSRLFRKRKRARGGGYYKKMLRGYATKKQLSSALARVGRDVRRNRSGISNNSRRISSLSRSTRRGISTVKKGMEDNKQMFMLTSLMGGGDKDFKVSNSSDNVKIPNGTTFTLSDEGDKFDKLLPLMMMGGMGGSKGGMMDNPLMMILLLDGLN